MSDAEAIELQLHAPERFHLGRTLGGFGMGPHDPSSRVEATRAAFATWTPQGSALLRAVHRPTEGRLDIRVDGDGAPWLADRVAGALGLEDDAESFAPIAGPVRVLWRRLAGMRLPRAPRVFDRVVAVVLLQLISWRAGTRSWRRLVRRYGEPAPGPGGLRLPPRPEVLAAASESELLELGVLPRAARVIRRAAREAHRIESAATSEDLERLLLSLPGVGDWTVQFVLGAALGHPDAVLLGDYNLPHTVAYALAGEERGDDRRLVELLEPYRGHRFRVIRLLWSAGIEAPRRAPRRDDRNLDRLVGRAPPRRLRGGEGS